MPRQRQGTVLTYRKIYTEVQKKLLKKLLPFTKFIPCKKYTQVGMSIPGMDSQKEEGNP
jgi:hypothetical protein